MGRVREVFARIAANPQLYATVYQDVRKAVVQKFPYVVLYKEEAGEVVVIAVFHSARDPAIWQGRV
jgi:plasmid stabilization system protein ParE